MGEYIYQQLCDNEVLQVCIIVVLVCLELFTIYHLVMFVTKNTDKTLNTMTLQQKAEAKAREYHKEKYNCDGICPDFIKGAEWAAGQLNQEKQQWLEKAYKWWKREFNIMNMQFHDSKAFYQNKLENFKKAMSNE